MPRSSCHISDPSWRMQTPLGLCLSWSRTHANVFGPEITLLSPCIVCFPGQISVTYPRQKFRQRHRRHIDRDETVTLEQGKEFCNARGRFIGLVAWASYSPVYSVNSKSLEFGSCELSVNSNWFELKGQVPETGPPKLVPLCAAFS